MTEAEIREPDEMDIIDPLAAVKPADSLFGEKHRLPEYLLLPDGIDKVSRKELRILRKDED